MPLAEESRPAPILRNQAESNTLIVVLWVTVSGPISVLSLLLVISLTRFMLRLIQFPVSGAQVIFFNYANDLLNAHK